MKADFHVLAAKAPEVEINPIDRTVDLVWSDGGTRFIVTLATEKELRLLVRRAIEVATDERERVAQEAGA
jgi:hypothetical protein